ncbi:MAG: glycosyltransferase [Pseudomonadales bacterium]|jgi:glycosyltransferase involved in cell wall biosynthesis|nr:glycosyltransferase [Pseudomonadales bacterium]
MKKVVPTFSTKKLPITLVMVVHNEESVIERAIKSVAPYVSEILVVHDGKCADKTKKIVKKYKGIFIEREYVGVAEPHRVYTYKNAKYEWLMQLDADEFLSADIQNNLSKMLNSGVDICTTNWPFVDGGKVIHNSHMRHLLFKKSQVYFIASPHEFVRPINRQIKTQHFNYDLIHAPKNEQFAWKTMLNKTKKWTPIHAQVIIDWDNAEKYNYSGQALPLLTLNKFLLNRYFFMINGFLFIPILLVGQTVVNLIKYRQPLGFAIRRLCLMIHYYWSVTVLIFYKKLFT